MKKYSLIFLMLSAFMHSAMADKYVIDKKGMHASIQFKISHLGYSWLWGRFNDFEGSFNYLKDSPEKSKVEVSIDTGSIDSNHAERDKHLRGDEFLDVKKYPKAKFVSTDFKHIKDGSGVLTGDFTLHGITRPISIDVTFVGEGKDPWGGYRAGFAGSTRIALEDYGITKNLGPASKELDLILQVEGVRE